jgi:hypothetical protein
MATREILAWAVSDLQIGQLPAGGVGEEGGEAV